MKFGHITDLRYAAVETVEDRIRLAHDGKGMVYVIDNYESSFSAPFNMVIKHGCIFNDRMDVYFLNNIEMEWVKRISKFAGDLYNMETIYE